jgi:hypothetical protein
MCDITELACTQLAIAATRRKNYTRSLALYLSHFPFFKGEEQAYGITILCVLVRCASTFKRIFMKCGVQIMTLEVAQQHTVFSVNFNKSKQNAQICGVGTTQGSWCMKTDSRKMCNPY